MFDFLAQSGTSALDELFSLISTLFVALIPLLYLFRMRGNRQRKNEERRRRIEEEEAAIAQRGSGNTETREDPRSRGQQDPLPQQEERVIGFLEALLTGQTPGTRVPVPATPDEQQSEDEEYVSPYDTVERKTSTPREAKPHVQYRQTVEQKAPPNPKESRFPSEERYSMRPQKVHSVASTRGSRPKIDETKSSVGFGFSTGLEERGIPLTKPVRSVRSVAAANVSIESRPQWQRAVILAEILGKPRALNEYSDDHV